ncbi:universal stress protein [Fibrella sp. WM1]|uniref:universal stress protein n=1 Tax=Fibrella musci TaxID=3242485 RepID=UPI003522F692
MYKLLLLTDFSAASEHAIAFAQTLFADTATDFCLLHTYPIRLEESHAGAMLLAEDRKIAETALEQLKEKLTQQPVPNYHTYRTMVALGGPVGVVDELISDEFFDLIVVGASGTGFAELFGSVATGLVRTAKTNVLVVPKQAPITPLQEVVLATDYRSVNDTESLTFLNQLAGRKGANLTLLTIEKGTPGDSISSLTRDVVEQALNSVQANPYYIYDDDVLHGIDLYLDEHRTDLLVLVPHHKGFFDVLLQNSVTRSIAFAPRVPLLTLYDAEQVTTKLKRGAEHPTALPAF